ncbi:1-phosphofructokinase [Paenibacillus piri]|uniref:Tagatose-6-phosphate kinase n=1 Tax=Paenibacillus piri TaxID=2547395 RepID=A0A4R5KCM4_9BACL|nr:1-phosphofructokinase [Paenibacillus piri]TDF92602.1 1-phosphofructokinase [Paenibacillus piri]
MITTVTLNAAIDKTYYVPRLSPESVMRVRRVFAEPGGKGINVARVAHQLGHEVQAAGFIGGHNGRFIRQELDRQGLRHDFIEIEGESRICLNIIDESDGSSTELLEPGPVVDAEAMERLTVKLRRLAAQSRVVCLSGSLPAGVPAGFYAELIGLAKREGAAVFLDTSGEALLRGAEAAPQLIKPNEAELAQLIGRPIGQSPADIAEQLASLSPERMSAACITVSLGADGSLTYYGGAYYRTYAPRIEAVNTVGCGDAFIAGMAVCMAEDLPIEEALRLATAAGSANALNEKAGYVNPEQVRELLTQVAVERLQ